MGSPVQYPPFPHVEAISTSPGQAQNEQNDPIRICSLRLTACGLILKLAHSCHPIESVGANVGINAGLSTGLRVGATVAKKYDVVPLQLLNKL